jgi:hypothetical protein
MEIILCQVNLFKNQRLNRGWGRKDLDRRVLGKSTGRGRIKAGVKKRLMQGRQ